MSDDKKEKKVNNSIKRKVPGKTAESTKGASLNRLDEIFYSADEREGKKEKYEERDFRPIKQRRDGRTGCLSGLMYFVFVVSISVILASVGWMAASDVLALNKPEIVAEIVLPDAIFTEQEIEVEDALGNIETDTVLVADVGYVAQSLEDAGIIEYAWLFELFCKVSNAEMQLDAGAYELTTDYDYRALVKKMQTGSGSALTVSITFPEGFTMAQIFELLEEEDVSDVDYLYEAAANYSYNFDFLNSELIGDSQRLEGYLFPDTYEFYLGEQASSVVSKFLDNFNVKFTADMYQQVEMSGYSLNEIMTIASMIEAEAANDEERAIIASVIYNRLNAGMPLEIDATVQYALPERKEFLTYADLEIDSPYNTYMYTGLPPGAVGNPGMMSIMAALNPADTGYYYYALDTATDVHQFFATAEEHGAFVTTQDYTSQ